MTQIARLHHLDGLRAGLMLAGVPYHATLAFAGVTWVIAAPDRNPMLGVVGETIHVARMPVFFLLAGLFATWVADRRGSWPWLTGRVRRLGIPLLFGVTVLGPVQILVLAAWGSTESFPEALSAMGGNPAYWIQHLWFLVDLLIFCALFAVLRGSTRVMGLIDALAALLARAGRTRTMAVVFIVTAGLATLAYVAWNQLGLSQRSAQVLSSNVFFYAVFFFAGVVFGRWEGGVAYLSNRPAPRLVLVTSGVVAVAVLAALTRQSLPGPESPLLALIAVVSASLAGVLAARLLFGLFGAHLNQDRPAVRWLVDSALVVYLVHQPIVIALSLAAIALRIDPVLAFLLVTASAVVLSLGVYEGVSRVRVLRLLLMGESRPVTNLSSLLGRS